MKIHTLDLRFQGFAYTIAAYLVEGPDGPVLIETGPASTLPRLRAELRAHGYAVTDIKHVLVTHIHLDHAGAAGWWASQGATVYVHHFGARHLIDPSKLMASATRIYGDQMGSLWGEMVPAPVERVVSLHDGDRIDAGGLTFTALETPGHARHHHVFALGHTGFAGDIAGIRLHGNSFIDLPAPPPEFDREEWTASIRRLREIGFERLYPTHFGAIADVAEHLDRLERVVEETTEWVRQRLEEGLERDDIVAAYEARVRQRGAAEGIDAATMPLYELANPLFMSVDGITRYWRKRVEG